MSDHSIVYDLQYPANGTLECHAAPDAVCRAVFDCECERFHDYHVVDGVPHHFDTYEDGFTVRAHHVGRFDPDECALIPWHEGSDEDVSGAVRVAVEPDWQEDYVEFTAVAAELVNPGSRSPGNVIEQPGQHMAEWARTHLAAQEPTDAEVEAAARALYAEDVNESYIEWPAYDSPQNVGRELYIERARNALSAARAARRDEEKSDD